MEQVKHIMEHIALVMEGIGVVIISIGAGWSLCKFLHARLFSSTYAYADLRKELGKAILLGLEILVAADIIATVVTGLDRDKVIALGIIVLIRILLSLSLQVEIEGQWPWQRKDAPSKI